MPRICSPFFFNAKSPFCCLVTSMARARTKRVSITLFTQRPINTYSCICTVPDEQEPPARPLFIFPLCPFFMINPTDFLLSDGVCAPGKHSRAQPVASVCVCLHRKIRLVSRNTLIKAPEPIKRNSIISYIMYLRGKTLVGSFLLFLPEFFSSFLEGVPCVLLCMLMSGESISPISFFCVTYISSFLLICSAEPAVAMLFFFVVPRIKRSRK